jgi:hypothetical protein
VHDPEHDHPLADEIALVQSIPGQPCPLFYAEAAHRIVLLQLQQRVEIAHTQIGVPVQRPVDDPRKVSVHPMAPRQQYKAGQVGVAQNHQDHRDPPPHRMVHDDLRLAGREAGARKGGVRLELRRFRGQPGVLESLGRHSIHDDRYGDDAQQRE